MAERPLHLLLCGSYAGTRDAPPSSGEPSAIPAPLPLPERAPGGRWPTNTPRGVLILAAFFKLLCPLPAQSQNPTSAPQTAPAPNRALDRYRQLLERNPAEGLALDRLWQGYAEAGQSQTLLDEYQHPPDTPERRFLLGLLLQKAGRPEDALAALLAAAANPGTPLARPALLAAAKLHGKLQRPLESAKLLEKALATPPPPAGSAKTPEETDLLLELGSALQAGGQGEAASRAWEKAALLQPENLELRRRIVDVYIAQQLGDRALPHIDHLRARSGPEGRVQALQLAARIHQNAGRAPEAIAALEEALAATGPSSWLRSELQSQLIRLHQRLHRTDELEARWLAYARANPRDLTAHLQLLDLYERLGEQERQLEWLSKLCELAPDRPQYRLRLARLQTQLDRLPEAGATYDQLLARPAPDPETVLERARIELLVDPPEKARKRVENLLAQHPGDEAVRSRILDFLQTHRLDDLLERELTRNAASGSPEAVSALASLFFSLRQSDKAGAALERLVEPGASPARQAAARVRIAQILREHGETPAARTQLEAALRLQPDSRDTLLALAELDQARENSAGARESLEKAFQLSRSPAERLEADQKLFDVLRAPADAQRRSDSGMADQLLRLTRAAAEKPSPEAWLRIARWQFWNRSLRIAQECAQRALNLDPQCAEAREFLVRLAASEGQVQLAEPHLDALSEADPSRRHEFRRRLAQIQMDAGHTADALRTYTGMVEEQPGNLQALEDLATAQQRAELWREALETWQKAEALAPAIRRREVGKILFRLQERLGQHQEAARLLLEEVDALAGDRGDDRSRNSALQELLGHCSRNGLLPWIQEEFERRRRERGEDTFTETALGRICKALGDKNRAFELLSDAALAAPNQAEALPELVREAEELRKLPAAIRLQGLLVRASPQWLPGPLEKLAQLQEKNGDLDAAEKTWSRLATRFPRDSAVLQHAADFELRWGTLEKSASLLRQLHALEPAQTQTLLSLARVELQSGSRDAARTHLEAVLQKTAPERLGTPLSIPGHRNALPGRIQNAYLSAVRLRDTGPDNEILRVLRAFWTNSGTPPLPDPGDARLRLEAIALLARMASEHPAERKVWVQRWIPLAKPQPGEAIAAFLHANAGEPLLETLAGIEADPQSGPLARMAFPWAALRFRAWDRLAVWAAAPGRTAEDRDCLAIAFSEFLREPGPRIPAEVLERFFPSDFRLWQAATALGQNGRLDQAADLATRLFLRPAPTGTPPPPRAGYRLEAAHWNLALGRKDAGLRLLEEAAQAPAESPESPAFQAIYERLLLAPQPERTAIASRFLEGQRPGFQMHFLRLLCHGMNGEQEPAFQALRDLLATRAVHSAEDADPADAASRHWGFLWRAGAQLQQWGLLELAAALWEDAVSDPARMALQNPAGNDLIGSRVLEVRTQLAAVRCLESLRQNPSGLQEVLRNHRRRTGLDGLLQLADLLESKGAHRPTIAILRTFLESDPGNPHAQRSFVQACRAGHDLETLQEVLPHLFPPFAGRPGASSPARELLLLLADFLEEQGQPDQSAALLLRAAGEGATDSRLQIRLAQSLQRSQKPDRAEAIYREILGRDPSNGSARLALASLLKSLQRPGEAAALLEGSSLPEAETLLVELHGLAGQFDEALTALERLPGNAQIQPALSLAVLLQTGQGTLAAQSLLRSVASRASRPGDAFTLQSALLRIPGAANDEREWQRLRQIAGEDPELAESLLLLQSELDSAETSTGRWADEWTRKWQDGIPAAGAALLSRALQTASADAEPLADQLLNKDGLSDRVLEKLLRVTLSTPRLHLKFLRKKAGSNPLDPVAALSLSEALEKNGQIEEAAATLELLGLQAGFQPDLPGKIAPGLARLGRRTLARHFFQIAVQNDPGIRNFETFLAYAKFLLAENEPGPAFKTLRSAFQNPLNQSYNEILHFMDATRKGQSPGTLIEELRPFRLPQTAVQTLLDHKSGPKGDVP
jgi:tetratricopeptide (TPR) repeat protein